MNCTDLPEPYPGEEFGSYVSRCEQSFPELSASELSRLARQRAEGAEDRAFRQFMRVVLVG